MSLRTGLRPPPGQIAECHPSLYEALCPTKDQKGRPIEGLTYTFGGQGDSWTVYVRWPLGGVSCVLAVDDPLSIWSLLERLVLGEVKVPWKEMRRTPRHLKNSSDSA